MISTINFSPLFTIEMISEIPNVPFYDFPQSPILILGFFGILVALFTVYTVNKAYFNSPFNDDNRGRN